MLKFRPQDYADRQALLSYSVVSRSCCLRAYARLFASVIVDIFVGPYCQDSQREVQYLQKFASILNSSLAFPHLGMVYHIQSFSFALQTRIPPARNELPIIYNIIEAGNVSLILDALHGPTHGVKFFGLRAKQHCRLDYTKLGHTLIRALHAMLHSSSLQRVSLCGLSNPPENLLEDICVETLEIYCNSAHLIPIIKFVGIDVLRHLTGPPCVENSSVHPVPNCLAPLKDLKQLCINLELPSVIFRAKAMPLDTANTLQTLHLNLTTSFFSYGDETISQSVLHLNRMPQPRLPFHLLHKLTSLHLSNTYAHDLNKLWAIRVFCVLLASCTLPPSLKMLSLESSSWVLWPYYMADGKSSNTFTRADWKALGSMLVEPTFARIPCVKIALTCRVDISPTHDSDDITEYDANILKSDIQCQLTALLHGFVESRRSVDNEGSSCFDFALTKGVGRQKQESTASHVFNCLKIRFGTKEILNAEVSRTSTRKSLFRERVDQMNVE